MKTKQLARNFLICVLSFCICITTTACKSDDTHNTANVSTTLPTISNSPYKDDEKKENTVEEAVETEKLKPDTAPTPKTEIKNITSGSNNELSDNTMIETDVPGPSATPIVTVRPAPTPTVNPIATPTTMPETTQTSTPTTTPKPTSNPEGVIVHYHGDGTDNGICPVCGLSYSPVLDITGPSNAEDLNHIFEYHFNSAYTSCPECGFKWCPVCSSSDHTVHPTPTPIPTPEPQETVSHYHGNGLDKGQCPVCGLHYSANIDISQPSGAGEGNPELWQ